MDETRSLEETVRISSEKLAGQTIEFIIVTSPRFTTPDCLATITHLQQKDSRIRHIVQEKPGVGGAIRDAFDAAEGEYVILMASDLETDPASLPDMIRSLESGYDIAATTRWHRGVRFKGYHPVKLVCNFVFQQFFRWLYWTDLTDLTYAYRAYRTEIVRRIVWEETRHPFLFESIVKPLRLGYRISEIDTSWKARTEGVSHARTSDLFKYALVGLRVRCMPRRTLLRNGE
jgi:glycosyltransferase involved in cell wall biosynthesis